MTSGNNAKGPRVRLASLDTPALSDALDRLGIEAKRSASRPRPVVAARRSGLHRADAAPRVSGRSVGDYIDDVAAGEVVVIDNGGRLDATVWGDILTTSPPHGVAGTVIDGVCRDGQQRRSSATRSTPGHTMRTGKDRVAAEAYSSRCNSPASVSNPAIGCAADADGVVVVPTLVVEDVLAVAEEIAVAEDPIRERAP